MNIYIAKDYNSIPMGIILADSYQIANAFFTGKFGTFQSLEEIDPNKDIGILGVCSLVMTKEKDRGTYSSPDKYREVLPR